MLCWPASCPQDRLPCGLCTKPHLPAPRLRWGTALADWSAERGQRQPGGAGGQGGGWGAREKDGEGQDPPHPRSSAGEVGSAELSMQRGNSPERSMLPAPAEGPPDEGGAPPHPEGGPLLP